MLPKPNFVAKLTTTAIQLVLTQMRAELNECSINFYNITNVAVIRETIVVCMKQSMYPTKGENFKFKKRHSVVVIQIT